MIWPVALSFTERDGVFAGSIRENLQAEHIGTYFYKDLKKIQVGALLYTQHIDVYATAHLIVLILRGDLRSRQYAVFEYQIALQREAMEDNVIFVIMEEEARLHVPLAAKYIIINDDGDSSRTKLLIVDTVRTILEQGVRQTSVPQAR